MATLDAGAADEVSEPKHRITKWLVFVGAVVMLAGLLFGYDQGVIGGALNGIEQAFHPSTFVIEIITSWVTLGALFGALAAGVMAEKLGGPEGALAGPGAVGLGKPAATHETPDSLGEMRPRSRYKAGRRDAGARTACGENRPDPMRENSSGSGLGDVST